MAKTLAVADTVLALGTVAAMDSLMVLCKPPTSKVINLSAAGSAEPVGLP